MKVESTTWDLLTSGALGNTVAGKARGGIKWLRSRVQPSNPNTVYQAAVRNALSTISSRWKNTLTDVQRAAWNAYAAAVLKQGLSLTGQSWYVAANSLRAGINTILELATPLTIVDDGPTTFTQAGLTAPVPTVDASDDNVSIAFAVTDEWNTAADPGEKGLAVWATPGQSESRQFRQFPFELIGFIQNENPALTSPQVLDLRTPVAAGERIFIRMRSTVADARFSPVYETSVIVQA